MRVIYVAGPFRGPNAWTVAENVRYAERWALAIARAGAMPLCPHANTALFHGLLTDGFWIDGTLALLERCDAAFFMPNWRQSAGAIGEHQWCERNGMRVFYADDLEAGALRAWVQLGDPPEPSPGDGGDDGERRAA